MVHGAQKPGEESPMPMGLKLGRRVGSALAIALLVLSGSCRDATAPANPPQADVASKWFGFPGFGSSPTLLSCPSSQTQFASGLISLDGGKLSLGGTSVTIPTGALLGPTTVELTIPAGQYMEVDLTVNNGQHITFQQPVVVTIDYSRCSRAETLWKFLSVWNIDPSTKALLQNMGGLDNKLTQSITFITPHFSGFAIAY
jgi:hypothetical protein